MTKRTVLTSDDKREALAGLDAAYAEIRRRIESGSVSAFAIAALGTDNADDSNVLVGASHKNFIPLVDIITTGLNDAHMTLHPDCEVCAQNRAFLAVRAIVGQVSVGVPGAPVDKRKMN